MKVQHISSESKACFLAESETSWRELRAVIVPVEAQLADDVKVVAAVTRELTPKYDAFRTAQASMPERTQEHYQQELVIIRLRPAARLVSLDSSTILLDPAQEVPAD